jgi:HSP20 family protein
MPTQLANRGFDIPVRLDEIFEELHALRTPKSHRIARVDMQRVDGALKVRADMPGIKPEDVHATVEDGMLTIMGESRHEADETEHGFFRRERYTGTYVRTIALPDHVNLDDIEATAADGVVEVTIPMQPAEEPRRIEIQPKAS